MTRILTDEELKTHPDYNYEETCPHCDEPCAVLIDDNDYTHYTKTCPYCGEKMMLCTLCHWDYGEVCDWNPETGCRIERAEKGLEPFPERLKEN